MQLNRREAVYWLCRRCSAFGALGFAEADRAELKPPVQAERDERLAKA